MKKHQKAKHFKCNMCPRRLNTAGGLAVHIQQVHKLEPENLPRIENALPGRDGYEVEIFGMEGIPAPDVADYKRRKEIELGLAAGSISQPPAKRPKTENRALSEDELKAALEAHRALMGAANDTAPPATNDQGAVYGAPPQAYSAPPAPAPVMPGPPPGMMPPGAPGASPFFPPPPGMAPGQVPFATFPAMMPPGAFPPPPVGMLPPRASAPGRPPMLPPTFVPQQQGSASPPPIRNTPMLPPTNGSFAPHPPPSTSVTPIPPPAAEQPSQHTLPNPSLKQTNPPFKKPTELKYQDANF
ncbi:hypothetical protein F5890DRAFT_110114 [Lentinula detonsa]|uniref:C2H2-type domain-containing protein n=1 Tax=Lentinula detonsa TaxID=2804962 RepID=A0AA38URN1_9AGAR|nr:hypothetical protein F5890DRAFT_110114 [Lentinula detonsa]